MKMTKASIAALKPPAAGRDYHRDEDGPKGLLLQVTATGAMTWQVYRKVAGQPTRITLGSYCATPTPLPESVKTGDDAASWIAQQRRQLDIAAARKLAQLLPSAGTLPQDVKRQALERARIEPTVAELLQRYVADKLTLRYKARGKLDERGRCAELDKLKAPRERIEKKFGKRKASELTTSDVNDWHAELQREGSHITANRAAELLRAAFGWNIEAKHYRGANPASGFSKAPEAEREVFLSLPQVTQLMQALAKQPPAWRDFFLLLLLTGQRRGAVAAMRWDQLDLAEGVWHSPAIDQKSGRPTAVVLVEQALQILRSMDRDASGFVFPSRSASGHVESPKGAWSAILADAGLAGVRMHDLRRTMGSTMANQGTSLHIVGKALGHKSHEATAIYARLQLDPVRAAQQRAADAFGVPS